MARSFATYLADAAAAGVTEHRLVAFVTPHGLQAFRVQGAGAADGQAPAFVTYDAAVLPYVSLTPTPAAAALAA